MVARMVADRTSDVDAMCVVVIVVFDVVVVVIDVVLVVSGELDVVVVVAVVVDAVVELVGFVGCLSSWQCCCWVQWRSERKGWVSASSKTWVPPSVGMWAS